MQFKLNRSYQQHIPISIRNYTRAGITKENKKKNKGAILTWTCVHVTRGQVRLRLDKVEGDLTGDVEVGETYTADIKTIQTTNIKETTGQKQQKN